MWVAYLTGFAMIALAVIAAGDQNAAHCESAGHRTSMRTERPASGDTRSRHRLKIRAPGHSAGVLGPPDRK
jgi:hypothetical protein